MAFHQFFFTGVKRKKSYPKWELCFSPIFFISSFYFFFFHFFNLGSWAEKPLLPNWSKPTPEYIIVLITTSCSFFPPAPAQESLRLSPRRRTKAIKHRDPQKRTTSEKEKQHQLIRADPFFFASSLLLQFRYYHLYTSSIHRTTPNTARLKPKNQPSAPQRCGLQKKGNHQVRYNNTISEHERESTREKGRGGTDAESVSGARLEVQESLFPPLLSFSLRSISPIWAHLLFAPIRQEAYLLSSLDASLRTGPQVLF